MIALSWSRWSDYAQCPRKFSLKYIAKAENFKEDPTKKSVHLQRGQNLHKQLEDYVVWKHNGQKQGAPAPALSPETEPVVPLIERLWLSSEMVLPETQLSINSQWQRVDWFAKDSYYRAILDLIAVRKDHGIIWDYKSGKFAPYADECGQLHLSAAMVIKMKGWDYVDVSYLFLDAKKPDGIRVTQDQVERIVQIFDERHARVNSETQWLPKKNDNCTWCEATKAQCPHAGEKRGGGPKLPNF